MEKSILTLIVILICLNVITHPLLGQSWLWAKSYKADNYSDLNSLIAGQDDNLIISGSAHGDIIFGEDTLSLSGGDELGFVARLDAIGEVVWSKLIYTLIERPGVPGYSLYSALAPDNSVVLMSRFADSISIGNDILISTAGSMYLAKLDEDGNNLWVKNFGPETYSIYTPQHVLDADGNIYVAGGVSGTTHFGDEVIYDVDGAIFITKFTPDGDVVWIRQCGGSGNVARGVHDFVVDKGGNVYLTGYTNQYESGEATVFGMDTITLAPWRDHVFLTKIDPDGNFVWTRTGGSTTPGNTADIPTSTRGFALATDADSTILLTGYFQDTIQFGDYQVYPLCGNNDCSNLYLIAFDLDGNLKWLKQPDVIPYGSTGHEVEIDGEQNIYLLGGATGTIGFNEHWAQTSNQNSIFVAMFDAGGECQWTQTTGANISLSDMTLNCLGESLVISGSYLGTSGHLEPFGIDTATTRTIFLAGLVDSISCQILTSIDEYDFINNRQTRIYPNPFNNLLEIDLGLISEEDADSHNIHILDASGRPILKKNATGSKFTIDGSDLPSGIYFVILYNERNLVVSTHKIIKTQ